MKQKEGSDMLKAELENGLRKLSTIEVPEAELLKEIRQN